MLGTVQSIVNRQGRNTQLCLEGIYNLVKDTEKFLKNLRLTQSLEEAGFPGEVKSFKCMLLIIEPLR